MKEMSSFIREYASFKIKVTEFKEGAIQGKKLLPLAQRTVATSRFNFKRI
jgi:hypothetical protein